MSKIRRKKSEEDVDVDMVPIMNMFLVLIPFLLMAANFMPMTGINTSVPVLENSLNAENNNKPKKETKVRMIIEIKPDRFKLAGSSDQLDEKTLDKLSTQLTKTQKEYPFKEMASFLKQVKDQYPASDTLILIPDNTVIYETIIRTMDFARSYEKDPLFPNVVISEKIS